MTACTTITASRANIYPPVLSRKTATETEEIQNDIRKDVDCDGTGVTITSSTWAIHPDDDDATLTLGTASFLGLVTTQPYSGGTAGKTYRVITSVQTSNGLAPEFTCQVVIAETVKIAFGAL